MSSGVELWQAIEAAKHAANRPVLLIDEIDKADSDVPNALLEVLGNRSFPVPPLGDQVVHAADGRLPLVIITTNEERELPPAFVRRCVVLNLNPPKDDITAWLTERARVHEHLRVSDAARQQAAVQVSADRDVATSHGHPPVGLAEYIDLLTALHELTATCAEEEQAAKAQLDWLQRLSAYALVKNADEDQTREPRSRLQSSPDALAAGADKASM